MPGRVTSLEPLSFIDHARDTSPIAREVKERRAVTVNDGPVTLVLS